MTLLDRYRAANSYEDRCTLHLQYMTAEGPRHDQTQLAIAHRRPDRLRIDITRGDSRLHILGDGKQARAWVDDPATTDMGHEVVQRPAPATWSIPELYSLTETLDPRQPQQMISLLLGLPLHLQATHLGLLLNDPYWQALLADPRRFEPLDEAPLPGSDDTLVSPPQSPAHAHPRCQRLRIATPDGPWTFWWDATTQSLRRLDLPTGNLFADTPADQRPTEVQLYIEWQESRWDERAASNDGFAFTARPGDLEVRYFVLPPIRGVAPESPSSPDPPATSDTEGDARTLKLAATADSQAAGQYVGPGDWREPLVVLAWVQDQEASHEVLPSLQRAAEQARAAGLDVRWQLVCADDWNAVSASQWAALLRRMGVELSTLRDPLASGRDVLAIEEAPTVVVLDPERRVKSRLVGADPQLADRLADTLQTLADAIAGSKSKANTAAGTDAQQAFEHHLQIARGVDREAPRATALPPARAFQRLRASTAWKSSQPSAPGNLLVWSQAGTDGGDRQEVVGILQEQREVWTMDERGEVLARHPLELADSQPPTHWERWTDREGTAWYALHAKFGGQVSVFDEKFRPVFSYPPQPLGSATVLDAELADLDDNGSPELYIGFSEPAGVHAVDATGRILWQQTALRSAAAMVAPLSTRNNSPLGDHLLTASLLAVQGDSGVLLPLGRGGEMAAAQSIGSPPRALHGLAAARAVVPKAASWLGLSYTLEGRPIAVGMDTLAKETWAYGLPAGVFRFQVHPPQWVEWPDESASPSRRGAWWVAGPDGSLHMIQDDGRLYDHLQTGQDIAGFAVAPRPRGVRLYVAHESEVLALDIQPPSQPLPARSSK